MPSAALDRKGGKRTFSAGANRSKRTAESRHPHSLKTGKLTATPQARFKPEADLKMRSEL